VVAIKDIMPSATNKHTELAKAFARVNGHIKRDLKSQDADIKKWLDNAHSAGGKRLRVLLALLAAQLCGRINASVERLAAALELFHYATLIHDDVIDNASQRRHQRTLNVQYGNTIAVLAGDLLFTRVMTILFGHVPDKIIKLVLEAAARVCLGEAHEQVMRGKVNVSVGKYKQIINYKTATLFATCCQGGAALAGGRPVQVLKLAQYGKAFGMAFQIQDDILDLIGKPSHVGKAPGTDLKEGSYTLPVILGIQQLKGVKRQKFLESIAAGNRRLSFVQSVLKQEGILTRAQALARGYARQAISSLHDFPGSAAKRELLRLAEFAVQRES
jgi:geranylgeranyl pyrophosphate synthase